MISTSVKWTFEIFCTSKLQLFDSIILFYLQMFVKTRLQGRQGMANEAFEMDPPKSPWHCPFQCNMFMVEPGNSRVDPAATFQRSILQDSGGGCSGDTSF